ncbi:hypothetical protein CAOG_03414 [Capsaspora owczarzaki ATCC 30864]|uniref:Rap-GAP domain-containing protein n=1 Tax=Capsaspora owczarzaki (strain ATCC 30864) TaxID=595528 RepID=A0A0D2VPL0_CAPO3|nr:hypothetical protein CAOG_03414 [Capsaspora owczarzaki ATCC 30864]KJE92437.1 hypothetical protein CAOG_003414 [Capsaspora owczarzaki ATCC 30864]|eukprot:XP_004364253.1 hypothetical protein CAOG_03414 [Capsaspora owczarzaki ATCC 30864]
MTDSPINTGTLGSTPTGWANFLLNEEEFPDETMKSAYFANPIFDLAITGLGGAADEMETNTETKKPARGFAATGRLSIILSEEAVEAMLPKKRASSDSVHSLGGGHRQSVFRRRPSVSSNTGGSRSGTPTPPEGAGSLVAATLSKAASKVGAAPTSSVQRATTPPAIVIPGSVSPVPRQPGGPTQQLLVADPAWYIYSARDVWIAEDDDVPSGAQSASMSHASSLSNLAAASSPMLPASPHSAAALSHRRQSSYTSTDSSNSLPSLASPGGMRRGSANVGTPAAPLSTGGGANVVTTTAAAAAAAASALSPESHRGIELSYRFYREFFYGHKHKIFCGTQDNAPMILAIFCEEKDYKDHPNARLTVESRDKFGGSRGSVGSETQSQTDSLHEPSRDGGGSSDSDQPLSPPILSPKTAPAPARASGVFSFDNIAALDSKASTQEKDKHGQSSSQDSHASNHRHYIALLWTQDAVICTAFVDDSNRWKKITAAVKSRARRALHLVSPHFPLEFRSAITSLKRVRESVYTPNSLLKIEDHLFDMFFPTRFKFGVVYVRDGQTHEDDVFANSEPSAGFSNFLSQLGDVVQLKGFVGYAAGLDTRTDTTGEVSVYTKWRDAEIMFHVATMLPYGAVDKQQLQRKRHIGNDVCVIVYHESKQPYCPSLIKSQFNHVVLVVRPETSPPPEVAAAAPNKSFYHVDVAAKLEVPQPEGIVAPTLWESGPQLKERLLQILCVAQQNAMQARQFYLPICKFRESLLCTLVNDIERKRFVDLAGTGSVNGGGSVSGSGTTSSPPSTGGSNLVRRTSHMSDDKPSSLFKNKMSRQQSLPQLDSRAK